MCDNKIQDLSDDVFVGYRPGGGWDICGHYDIPAQLQVLHGPYGTNGEAVAAMRRLFPGGTRASELPMTEWAGPKNIDAGEPVWPSYTPEKLRHATDETIAVAAVSPPLRHLETMHGAPKPGAALSDHYHRPRNKETGYSLLELLIVVAIIMLLGSLVVSATLHSLDRAKVAKLEGDAHAIRTELEADRIIRGHYVYGLAELSLGDIDLSAWHYHRTGEIAGPMSRQGFSGAPAGLLGDNQVEDNGAQLDEINPFGELEYRWYLQVGSLVDPVAPLLNKSFGWMTGGGMALRFTPLFVPAAPVAEGGGGGGGSSGPVCLPGDLEPGCR